MWPFRRKRSGAEAAKAVMDDAISLASERWLYFCQSVVFRDEVPLVDRVAAFHVPFEEGLRRTFPQLTGGGSGLALIVTVLGIEQSGTHSRDELEKAFDMPLPVRN